MDECLNKKKFFGGCKFEPRYDLGPADISRFESISGTGAVTMFEKLRAKTYVHDICVRCGKIVRRA